MINITPTKKIYILSSFSLAFIIGIISFVLYPLYNSVATLNQKIYDQRVQLAIYQQQRDNLEETRTAYNKIKNDIENISRIFIDQEQILDMVDVLESTAENNSVIQNINLSTIDQIETDNSFELGITLNGDWLNLMTYFGDLEKLDYYLTLDNLNFTKKDKEVNLVFTATIYTQSF